jgi:hypothetical protein
MDVDGWQVRADGSVRNQTACAFDPPVEDRKQSWVMELMMTADRPWRDPPVGCERVEEGRGASGAREV